MSSKSIDIEIVGFERGGRLYVDFKDVISVLVATGAYDTARQLYKWRDAWEAKYK